MGGGGSSSGFHGGPSFSRGMKEASIKKQLNDAEYRTSVNKIIDDYLSESQRDTSLTSERLDALLDALSSNEDIFKTLFGGSVKKHTYVDGLSDVDVLLIVNDTSLQKENPNSVKEYVYNAVKSKRLENVSDIKMGDLAITICYNDDNEIQLLPAIRKNDGFRIADSGERWSSLIHPDRFTKSLIDTNRENSGKVIHTIRIIKSIQSELPKDCQLSGYHIESLAVKSFKNNKKSMSSQERVLHFLNNAQDYLKAPIKDRTNQSAYVDSYLGDENSSRRKKVINALREVQLKLESADRRHDVSTWKSVLGLDDI